jgi:hypothetical protein
MTSSRHLSPELHRAIDDALHLEVIYALLSGFRSGIAIA